MRILQQLEIGIFEQIKLDLADLPSTNFPLKNFFAKIINNRLQNVIKGCSPLQFQTYKSTTAIGIQSCRREERKSQIWGLLRIYLLHFELRMENRACTTATLVVTTEFQRLQRNVGDQSQRNGFNKLVFLILLF